MPTKTTSNRTRKPRKRVEYAEHYKAVAVVKGRYFSVFDGTTEYKVGELLSEPCRPRHEGGFYCYPKLEDLLDRQLGCLFPAHSILFGRPLAILRCKVAGRRIKYSNNKCAFSQITPIAVVETKASPDGTYHTIKPEEHR